MLILDHLQKSFGDVRAVDDVSLTIQPNEFFTLLGPSGCGKTTLLRLIAGLETADKGKIMLAGKNIAPLPAHKRPVNTVFQNYALFPHMTVFENIGFGLRMRGEANIRGRVWEALKLVRMEELGDRKPSELSGGQQQRVALARALVNRPQILLLDESLSALDYKLRKEMQLELKHLQKSTGITFIFVTHDQNEALSMSDRIAVMDEGKVVQVGTPQEIYSKPASRFVAGFIGTCSFVPANTFGLKGGEVGFRPEDVTLQTKDANGTVTDISYHGNVTYCLIKLDSGHVVVATGKPDLAKNARVRVVVPNERMIRCAQ